MVSDRYIRFFSTTLWAFLCAALLSCDVTAEGVFIPRKPGRPLPSKIQKSESEDIPDIESSASDFTTIPDRWRHYYGGHWYDPYNTNILKGDLPIFGSQKNPWFLELGITSQSLGEWHDIPVPVGGASTNREDSINLFGDGQQYIFNQNFIFLISLYQGNTSFKPPNFELRFSPVFNVNYVGVNETGLLNINPGKGLTREDHHFGVEEFFADIHLANISDRYDFISSRIGIQKFNADFKGFLFFSAEPGLRIFGNADSNRWQYNLAYFRRLEKDTNSGVNVFLEDRHEDVFVANVFHQDLPALGHTLEFSVVHREDRAGDEPDRYNNNGFLVRPASIGDERPKNISSTYLGLNGDGHLGRLNLSESFYFVFGDESHNPIAGRKTDIRAWQSAVETSYDFDWIRARFSFFWASGDDDPFDDTAGGFDAISDNPQFAGADNSYWQRQGIPFIAGGGVNLVNRNSLLANLRSGKEEGQSNFVNPGLRLLNVGLDLDITPKLKLVNNFNFIQFDDPSVLRALRQDAELEENIGYDFSSGMVYRPFLNNHLQLKAGVALFVPEDGFEKLFGDDLRYQAFGELILQY